MKIFLHKIKSQTIYGGWLVVFVFLSSSVRYGLQDSPPKLWETFWGNDSRVY